MVEKFPKLMTGPSFEMILIIKIANESERKQK